ncbi:MAG: leucine-rich repeat domain-containing protein, partial [Treponema sp.]|nr:leucine-rich repeat domain-containing protein [Treponema sp.]
DRAFQNCAYVTSVTFASPSSVNYIGEYAFLGCGSLTSIDIPSSIIRIWDGVFEKCVSLKSVSISSRTEVRGDAFPENVQINYRE